MTGKKHTRPVIASRKSGWLPSAAPSALFLALILVWVGWHVRPAAGFQRNGPLFFLTREFFASVTSQPGGWLEYGAAAWGQLDCADWSGAAGFTVLAGLALGATRLAWPLVAGGRSVVAPFVPPLLLLCLRQQPGHSASSVGLGFALAVLLAVAGDRLKAKPAWLRLAFVAAVSPLAARGAGFWPWALFLGIIVWSGARCRPSWPAWSGLLLGAVTAALALAGADIEPARLWNPWSSPTPPGLASAVYLCLPALALLWWLGAVLTRLGPVWLRTQLQTQVVRRIGLAGFALAAATGVGLSFDRQEHELARLEYASSRGDDAEVLRVAARLATLPADAEVRLHRALYRSGRLLADLFTYTNQVGWALLPGMEGGADAARAQAETLLELGQVNEAEHLAHEVLEFDGDRPDMLRLLADVNVLKDRPDAARTFLRVLQRTPAHRSWAAGRLQAMQTDPALSQDARLRAVRECMVTTDLPHDGMPTATLLEQLLHSNPRNRMALEYLLAHRLLTLDLDRFVARLPTLQQFSGSALPRHCEEAVALQQALRPDWSPADLPPLRPETHQRFRAWRQALESGTLRTEEGRHALASRFGDTYWYYHLLHLRSQPTANTRPPS